MSADNNWAIEKLWQNFLNNQQKTANISDRGYVVKLLQCKKQGAHTTNKNCHC